MIRSTTNDPRCTYNPTSNLTQPASSNSGSAADAVTGKASKEAQLKQAEKTLSEQKTNESGENVNDKLKELYWESDHGGKRDPRMD